MLMWRITRRLRRRVGWGGLLVPVAAMGMALAGVHFWTVALVLIALTVVIRKPLLAAALLPLSMVSAGLAGLMVAAFTPGGSVNYFVRAVAAKPLTAWVALPQVVAGYVPAKGGLVTWVTTGGTVWGKGKAVSVSGRLQQVPWVRYWAVRPAMVQKPLAARYMLPKPRPPAAVPWSVEGVSQSPGWWQGRWWSSRPSYGTCTSRGCCGRTSAGSRRRWAITSPATSRPWADRRWGRRSCR